MVLARGALSLLAIWGMAIWGLAAPADADLQAARGRVDGKRVLAANESPGDWLVHGRTWDEQRFSPLDQIQRGNVEQLGLAWSWATDTRRGLEATPIVVDGVMYATGTWSRVYALDAATGRLLWRFDPGVPRWKGRHACCDVVNRGVAVWKGRVYVGTIDARLIALDAATGDVAWDVATADPSEPYTITGAPRVLEDLVIIGNGGADLGVRGFFSAYAAETGALVWRFYTVPASKEGPHEHPELAAAAATWPAEALFASGLGGTVWDSFTYDPELDLLYAGVGNSAVYDRAHRSPGGGDNLYLASILAVRPKTGELVWHYQTTPGEHWDYTATQHMILADLALGGAVRKVLLQAPKNGFFYVIDRATGELVSAEPYVDVSWATHVDLATGRPVERREATWSEHPAFVTPGPSGGHNWHPMSFSPRTGLVYIPTTSSTYAYTPDPDFRFTAGTWNTGEDLATFLGGFNRHLARVRFCSPTHLTAWNPVTARRAWRVDHDSGVPAGVLSTAGDLVFQGAGSGTFSAYDARSGERVWQTQTGVGIMAPPVTYQVGEAQYVAVLAGLGGSHGGHFTQLENANEGRILAFRLGGTAAMPPVGPREVRALAPPALEASVERVEEGSALYHRHCFYCHGAAVVSSGLHPDLRFAPPEVHAGWNDIVLGGTRASRGMASFADVLGPRDAEAIRAYVVARALETGGAVDTLVGWLAERLCVPASWMAD